MEVFAIRYWYENREDYGRIITELFYDETEFKSRLTKLQDDYWSSVIETFSGYIPKIMP